MTDRRRFLTRIGRATTLGATAVLAGCSESAESDAEADEEGDEDGDDGAGTTTEQSGSDTMSSPQETESNTSTTTSEPDVPAGVTVPQIEFGTAFSSGESVDDFGETDGCGKLTIYTAGGSASVSADRLKIVGSSFYPDGKRWSWSMHYNNTDTISPEPRADEISVRVQPSDEIQLRWITDDDETVTLANFGSMSQYC